MRVKKLSLALPILVSLTLACQAPVEEMVATMEEDLTAIRGQAAAFQNAIRTMDFSAAAEVMAEDIVVMVPNQASIVGRAGWSEWVEASWPITEIIQYDLGIENLHVSGDFAYLLGTFSESLTLEGMEEPYVDEGKALQIWRKDDGGVWRIAVDSWSSNLPLPTPDSME